MLNNTWTSTQINRKTKIRVFNSNIQPVLLYGCESWAVTKNSAKIMQNFSIKCLRRIMKIFGPARISNRDLWNETKQIPVTREIRKRKWDWIGHTLRKNSEDITRRTLRWSAAVNRSRGRAMQTWRRVVEETSFCKLIRFKLISPKLWIGGITGC